MSKRQMIIYRVGLRIEDTVLRLRAYQKLSFAN